MKIAVLLSGGVDSSVALRLLKDRGYDLTAFYLKIWLEDELQYLNSCPWEEDLKYAQKICDDINVPLEIVPLQKEYFDTVVNYTINEVKEGRTPNPDIMCNSMIKFGSFFEKLDPSFEKIATGHYAQIEEKDDTFYLKKAPDAIKDQTYFLSNLKQEQLSKLLFPIGHLTKREVRDHAKKYHLPNQDRKDSQGICFLGKLKYTEFLKQYLKEKPGDIIELETGLNLGKHEGYYYYTIGQRKGIKLAGGPYYVAKKDVERNIIYVSKHYHEKNKKRDTFKVENFNLFSKKLPKQNLQIKLRHGEKQYNCLINRLNDFTATIKLDKRDQGIAPGQYAVFYDGDLCLGSAMISESEISY